MAKTFTNLWPRILDWETLVEAEAGTATTRRAWTAQRVRQAIQALALGEGQTWQTPSRALNTVYTNNTARPIFISVTVDGSGGLHAQLQVRVNSSPPWNTIAFGSPGVDTMTAIIPAGHQYRALGGDGLQWWAELR